MANKITNTQYYSDIANAIRTKNGLTTTYKPPEMAQAILDIPAGGGTEDLKNWMNMTTQSFVFPEGVTKIPRYFFAYRGIAGRTLKLPRTINDIRGQAFFGGYYDTVDLGETQITEVSSSCFENFEGTESIILPETVTRISSYAFKNALYVKSINIPTSVTAILSEAFYQCKALTGAIVLPAVKNITRRSFFACNSITSLDAPIANSIDQEAFSSCTSLAHAKLAAWKPSSVPSVFQNCTQLVTVDIGGEAGTLGSRTFQGCSVLDAVIIRATALTSLAYTNAFTNTPIESGTGYIYVPRDLISTYEAATNWSTYAGQFRAIEDYTVDGTIDGEFVHP